MSELAAVPDHVNTVTSGIESLPYDIVLALISFLSADDSIHFLSASRTLYALTRDEGIWRHLAGRFGLHDIKHFGGLSFYSVYTRLLHTYAPLLGLWAGDHPYTGNLLYFYLDAGDDERQGGIVGEMLRFRALEPEETDLSGMPELPTRLCAVRIGFEPEASRHDPRDRSIHSAPRLFCCHGRTAEPQMCSETRHGATLSVMSETNQGIFLHTRQGQFRHPDFPGADADRWCGSAHRLPRLKPASQETTDQTLEMSNAPRPRGPVVFTAPTDHTTPVAISIACERDCWRANAPFLGFENRIPHLPRYYPLRGGARRGMEPLAEDWDPRSLAGLWLGSYGPHGTECVCVCWDARARALHAAKVTGDENVPRGAVSWTAQVARPCEEVRGAPRGVCARAFGDLARCRVYPGTGMTSARGYMPHQRELVQVLLGVVGPDEVRVWWFEDDDVDDDLSIYVRWEGPRDRGD
ncbi:hypothetical protein AcW1_006261 [Taiwanofungus camphoratus]|nr:hypothetical protein AcW1_006261 [Antrodia cinnamomea]